MKVTAGSPATNEEGICMNIIVLAGGTSTERAVSIVSGTQVTKALRSIGHCAVLLDVFAGDGRIEEGLSDEELKERVFTEEYDLNSQVEYISSFNDMIEEMIAVRKRDRIPFFGPNVLRISWQCPGHGQSDRKADVLAQRCADAKRDRSESRR